MSGTSLSYDATAGQNNVITVDETSITTVVITDSGGVTAGAGCAVIAGPALQCTMTTASFAQVTAGDGDDTVTVTGTMTTVLDGGDGTDTLNGGGDHDHLIGGPGADHLNGGLGDDTLTLAGCSDVASGGDGADTIELGGGGAQVDAGPGNDVITPRVPDCVSGNDIHGGAGVDALDASMPAAQTGWPVATPAVVTLDDVADDGPLTAQSSNVHSDVENVFGGSEDDFIAGTSDANTLYGDGGDDVIDGGTGQDVLAGGDGEDIVDYSARTAPVRIDLTPFSTTSGQTGENDSLSTFEDAWGGSGNDTLIGDVNDNVLDGGPGADTISGHEGEDVADYSDRTVAVTVSLDGVANDGAAGEGDNVATDVEDVWGGSAGDILTGSAQDNLLDGGGGADTLNGGGGSDTLDGGLGPDVLNGGDGLDVVDYSARTAAVAADLLGTPNNDGEAGEGDSIGADVEGLIGGSGGDVLVGNTADGLISGGAGADHISDPGGKDTLSGGDGGDVIGARDGAVDTIACGQAADQVNADATDTVAGDCETVTHTDPPPPASPGPPETFISSRPAAVTRFVLSQFRFGSSVAGAIFRCTLDGHGSICTSGSFQTPTLSEGVHVFSVAAMVNGVTDPSPDSVRWRVDLTKPAVKLTLPRSRCIAAKGSSIRLRATDASAVQRLHASFGAKTLGDKAAPTLRLSVKAKQLGHSGKRKLTVKATDEAGNTATKGFVLKACPARA